VAFLLLSKFSHTANSRTSHSKLQEAAASCGIGFKVINTLPRSNRGVNKTFMIIPSNVKGWPDLTPLNNKVVINRI
jgi:hypothetical protein